MNVLAAPSPQRSLPAGEFSARFKVDWLQHQLSKLPPADMPLVHRFTPGLYIREITMPAGTCVISRIHRTTHPFVVTRGRALVWSPQTGVLEIAAPHTGITVPGTQRVLLMLEETVWTTFHANPDDEQDPAVLCDRLTEMPDVAYIAEMERVARGLVEDEKTGRGENGK